MAFTYDITTDVGKLRLAIGDTLLLQGPRPSRANYSDAEIQYFLDTEASIGRASVMAFDSLAAEWSSFTNITLGPRREEFAKIAEAYSKRADKARTQFGGGSSFSVGWERQDGYHDAAMGTVTEYS
jgi:hypothetical protein